MVVLLSVLAEKVSPRFAGVLSGYPLGAAISLFFIGYEIGPEFAGQSAVYTMVGLAATQTFAFCYYLGSLTASPGLVNGLRVFTASLCGIVGYFVAAFLLHVVDFNLLTALLISSGSILLFARLFRKIENVKIENRVSLNARILLLRSLAAAGFIVIITSTASLVGTRWAGLFSAFPITMLPFVVIIHFTYDTKHVHAILKNVPRGIGSLVAYSLVVSIAYPTYGIYAGTLLAYLLATLYLVMIHIKR
jgi:hypothetical protein